MAESSAIRQSKTILARSCEGCVHRCTHWATKYRTAINAANKSSVAIANFVNVCTASRRILGRIIGSQSPSVQESLMTCWLKYYIRRSNAIVARSCEAGGRLRQRHGLILKGKRISCPPQYGHRDPQGVPLRLGERHCFDHDFPLIRSLRASAQRSASVLFSFALSFDCGGIIDHPAIKNDSSAIWRRQAKGSQKVATDKRRQDV
jgi:hypothetical protein